MTHHPFDDGLVRQRTIETFQLEPSMGCQLDCPGCIKKAERSSWVPRTPFGHMTLKPEVVYKIVLDLKAAGIKVKKFDMQGSGEPLLNKKIWEMCGFLAEHYSDSVISICTHANAEFRPDMVMSGVNEILFAIDGVDQESYAPWRVHGNFDRAYRFMRDFSVEAAAKAPHIRRVWKYVLFSHNDTDAQLLRAQQLVSTQRSRSCALLSRNWPGFVPRIRRVGHTPPGPESEHRGRQLSYPSIAVDLQSPRSADSDS
jgi:hypothetical protein